MRRDDYGLSWLPCACYSIPQQPSGHRVHPSWRFVQEDDWRPANQSHSCTQLPLVATTACVGCDIIIRHLQQQNSDLPCLSQLTCSYEPVYQHEAPATETSGHSPRRRTHTSLVFLWAGHTCSEFLFPSCDPAQHQTGGSNQCAAAPVIQG